MNQRTRRPAIKAQLNTGSISTGHARAISLLIPYPPRAMSATMAKLKVMESREMAEKDASPMLLRLSFGRMPVRSSGGRFSKRCRKDVFPRAAPQEISHMPITTEAMIPTVAAVIASDCISSTP